MNPVRTIPDLEGLTTQISRFSNREELGAYEAIMAIKTLCLPILRCSGHDIDDLTLYADMCGVVSARDELNRLIKLEELALAGPSVETDDRTCREANLELMRLIVGTRIHNDMSFV